MSKTSAKSSINSMLIPTGQFCTVEYITTGGIHKINGRTGVSKYTNNLVEPLAVSKKYFTVYVRDGSPKFDKAIKINKNLIVGIKAQGMQVGKNPKSKFAGYLR
jgi:hypothetical protein